MAKLSIEEIIIRILLSLVFSGLIGFEREKNNSGAGLKTHILVSIGAIVIAMIQIDAIALVSRIDPRFNIRVDVVRLIAQVVSGIGFLGAGTIIVTKTSILGLTTAASIWCVSGIGLALGMGFYEISIAASLIIVLVLVVFKRVFVVHNFIQILIRFVKDDKTIRKIEKILEDTDKDYELVKIKTEKNSTSHIYKIKIKEEKSYKDLVKNLAKVDKILDVEHVEIF